MWHVHTFIEQVGVALCKWEGLSLNWEELSLQVGGAHCKWEGLVLQVGGAQSTSGKGLTARGRGSLNMQHSIGTQYGQQVSHKYYLH